MKYSQVFFAGLVLVFSLIFVSYSFSETKILLKNGRSFTADGCREYDGKLRCYIMGGVFEFDKDEIENLKEINIERPYNEVPEEKAGQEAAKEGKGPGNPEAETKAAEKQPGDEPLKGLKPEEEKRLDQINKKKIEYQTERQKLIDERDKLHADVKSIVMIRTQQEYDALKKRITDLETRINTFNGDVKKLNEEEQNIVEGSKNKQ